MKETIQKFKDNNWKDPHNPGDWWDKLNLFFKKEAVFYCRNRNKKLSEERANVNKQFMEIQGKIDNNINNREVNMQKLEETKTKIANLVDV